MSKYQSNCYRHVNIPTMLLEVSCAPQSGFGCVSIFSAVDNDSSAPPLFPYGLAAVALRNKESGHVSLVCCAPCLMFCPTGAAD